MALKRKFAEEIDFIRFVIECLAVVGFIDEVCGIFEFVNIKKLLYKEFCGILQIIE